MDPVDQPTTPEASEVLDASRRAFLKNAGKIAVYTPPAMLALSSPSFKAIAQSSGGNDQSPSQDEDWWANWWREFLRRLFGR